MSHILVVDDSPEVMAFVACVLERAGHRVTPQKAAGMP